MSARFQELDWRRTPLGELVLRRRWDPMFDREVHEIKLNDEFLMSSLFTVSEVEMAHLALAGLPAPLDVVVGGLGLGYTARTVLENPNVRSMLVVDALGEVIEWHRQGLLPGGAELAADPRCRLVHGDFFALARSGQGLDPEAPGRRFHAIIVDIDHSPRHLLHPDNADFYQPEGLGRLADSLHPGGVFALWSNEPPDDEYTAALTDRFEHVSAEIVRFPNPLQQREATSTVYVAKTSG
ncbi:spermidine synthase [Saccharothrix ecbatanensis]|jgi:spermidine synthase|uniref:Spermidine synthase n=1 Tax=Saccharothrix ecbatanensis TaxID=1105145 RepID=A0A7W9HI60_9PSEU|nr:spermidine synthase [Saccharothrix ecbatanensis]MBB5802792.1 spermidine synthase [Saccharothrix ecbatanensis]